MLNLIRKWIYFFLYYLFYKYSGAHNKPTSDKKYNPEVEHQSSYWYKLLRAYERYLFRQSLSGNTLDGNKLNTIPLPEISADQINPILFRELTKNKTCPLVIRGLIKNSPAVKKWSADYFIHNYGQTEIITLQNNEEKARAYTSFNQNIDGDYMSIKESITNMTSSNGKFYINNVTEIFQRHPELADDLDLNHLHAIDSSIDQESWLKINLFMGGPGSGSSLHCAVAGNFFHNIHGKKKWILIDPKYTPFLKSTPAKDFGFVISGYDLENLEDIREWNQKIPKYEVLLESGDVLFVPPWWWHYVHNESDFTIACAVRDHTVYWQSLENNLTFTLMSPYLYKLNPWFLSLAELIKGRSFLKRKSMESDRSVIGELTGKYLESK